MTRLWPLGLITFLTLGGLSPFLVIGSTPDPTTNPNPTTSPATPPSQTTELSDQPASSQPNSPAPQVWDSVIRPNDRVLFVGDELTQQMFYTRAVAAAILSLRPDYNLRFFNGGYEGATAASAMGWIGGLLDLARPTVVFVCLGLNDAQGKPASRAGLDEYAANLTALVDHIKARPGVRLVVILGPPATQLGLTEALTPDNPNYALLMMAGAARDVAGRTGSGFVDLFDHTGAVYLAQMKAAPPPAPAAAGAGAAGEPLTVNGRLPSETGHLVIASIILRGIGVTAPILEPAGWSPVLPRRMARVRPALALNLKPPTAEAAQRSQALYESMQPFDEAFFELWRLAGRHRSAPRREAAAAAAEAAWRNVRAAAARPEPAAGR